MLFSKLTNDHLKFLDFSFYVDKLEKEWKASQPKIDETDYLRIFPEAKETIPFKINEYEAEREELVKDIRQFQKKVKVIAKKDKEDDFFVEFWCHLYPKYFIASRIVEIDKHLKRLRYLFGYGKILIQDYTNWEIRKEKAKNYSLAELASPYLEKVHTTSSQIIACCPFHQERTPSFVIYVSENRYHCYGCQVHGDSIDFFMQIHHASFSDAVKELSYE